MGRSWWLRMFAKGVYLLWRALRELRGIGVGQEAYRKRGMVGRVVVDWEEGWCGLEGIFGGKDGWEYSG
jgi:hypothetical protein